jgi:hypothetical protein
MTQKLKADDIERIYRSAWNPNYTIPEVAKKYGICEGYVNKIKHGVVWSNITGHAKGTIPELFYKRKQKSVKKMSNNQKIAVLLKGQEDVPLIDDKYWKLFVEYGQDTADEFKQRIYGTRKRFGRRLTIDEVEEIFKHFLKIGN